MTQLTLFADLTPGAVPVPAPVVVPKADEANGLMQLAELIRQGREQMQAQARRRSRPVQSIGDLAQAVLLRHDLVARRRARTNPGRAGSHCLASDSRVGTGAAARQADLADTVSEVHVAS
ncbi:hypothetical protein [Neorhodopirellula pilleata]|uniref:Uncharacterized protein n=1 Tax=Neorhodopirellula pilleata TaxID=2714738 RepID=A0A5C5ZZL9_9BACT|nr:hypothetical protein [Neorhodopirellula pilleata]TWT92596.1 hypothetical protein Pla100_46140 [Neorhodopirellula pilleata]